MLTRTRLVLIHGVLVGFAVALVVKAAHVQLWQRARWTAMAERQHFAEGEIPAPRGDIVDATGEPLARSRELVRLVVEPQNVTDRARLLRELRRAGVGDGESRRAVDRRRKWVEVRGQYLPSRVAGVVALKGVRSYPVGSRVYTPSEGALRLVGRTDAAQKGTDGLELFLDSLLRGEAGRSQTLRGARGERFEAPDAPPDPPKGGHTVELTINTVLQEICDEAIMNATRGLDADGGDIVVLDPHSGEIRCLASHRKGSRLGSAPTLLEPFEPGSTLKPFYAGYLLEHGLATPETVIDTYNGVYTVAGRTITDVHRAPRLSLAEVIKFSSNVGIARFTERMTDGEMYRLLRDIGFGTATGVPFPTEASGILREPRQWSRQSHASLAIGYELAVTPLQLALAYSVIANGGELVAPALIKEIRDADGAVVYRHRPRVLRRVFEEGTTATLRRMLESVVDSGTAQDAGLATFDVAGKSGTARRTVGGRYGHLTYTSSFVALFPASRPQYVVLVKIDNPRGSYYGGKTAAPISKTVIQAALAARDASLDWGNLVRRGGNAGPDPGVEAVAGSVALDSPTAGDGAAASVSLVDTAADPVEIPPVTIDLVHPRDGARGGGAHRRGARRARPAPPRRDPPAAQGRFPGDPHRRHGRHDQPGRRRRRCPLARSCDWRARDRADRRSRDHRGAAGGRPARRDRRLPPGRHHGADGRQPAVADGAAFVAVRGSAQDGHAYLAAASRDGMALAIVEDASAVTGPALVVRDSRQAAAVAAAVVHGHPADSLSIVGVTGTSGKTTVASMLRHLLDREGRAERVARDPRGPGGDAPARRCRGRRGSPPPDRSSSSACSARSSTAGVRSLAMEVSSHALAQQRIGGVRFACAVFTNLSRDHLDYHGTMDEYFAAKARLVALLADGRHGGGERGRRHLGGPAARAARRALRHGRGGGRARDGHPVRGRREPLAPRGAGASRADVTLPLIGDFNVSNALAAAAAAWSLGDDAPPDRRTLRDAAAGPRAARAHPRPTGDHPRLRAQARRPRARAAGASVPSRSAG